MFGPVYNAGHTPPSLLSLVLGEVIGTTFAYIALFGELKRVPQQFSRIVNVLAFSVVGLTLTAICLIQLGRLTGNPWIGIIPLIATVILLAALRLSRALRFRGTATWPVVEGRIENCDVREIRTRSSHYFVAEAAYSYRVEGEYYSGRFSREFAQESEAWDYVSSIRNALVQVKFDPAKAESSLVLDDNASTP